MWGRDAMVTNKAYSVCLTITICLLWFTYSINTSAQEIGNVKKSLQAVRTENPPTIDGRLDDSCWQNSPQATGFIDRFTGKAAADQTIAWLLYDDKAIYVAFKAFESQPDKIIARQTKDQTNLFTDDTVTFNLDPYHTHQWNDQNFFAVNPLGTKWANIAGGRADKPEWLGLWKAAAQRTDDGWTAELEIPWQILTYPNTKIPITMGLNFERRQQRIGADFDWSHLGYDERIEYSGHWVEVLPPKKWREIKFLPYAYFGRSQKTNQSDQNAIITRAGLDLRYALTPQLTLVSSFNPDFENVEQAVEGIDFSYGARFVSDRRPFFQEGRDILKPGLLRGEFYHSRQISEIDSGVNLFGKLSNHISVGTLGTFDQNGNHNILMRIRPSLTATSYISPTYLRHHDNFGSNDVIQFEGVIRHKSFSVGGELAQTWLGSKAGRLIQSELSFSEAGYALLINPFLIEPDFVNKLGFHPFTGIRGGKFNMGRDVEWRSGLFRRLELFSSGEVSDQYDGSIFRRTMHAEGFLRTHSDYGLLFEVKSGRFEKFHDRTFSGGLWGRVSDQFTNYRVLYSWGRQAGYPIRFLHPRLSLKIGSLTTGIESQFLWHIETKRQHILTFNYDFTPALSLGGRLIWQDSNRNVYFALRRSGYAGTDIYIILGDPNAKKFQRRFVGKIVKAL